MAEHKLSTFDQLKKLALAGKRDSAKQVAELAELVAAGLEDLQHIGISVTLPAANWSGGAQTVAHASLLADSNYIYLVGADAGTRNVYDRRERRQCNHKRADDFPVRYNADR